MRWGFDTKDKEIKELKVNNLFLAFRNLSRLLMSKEKK